MENLKGALRKLEQKLAEAQSKADLLLAEHRRSRAVSRASEAHMAMREHDRSAGFERMKEKVACTSAVSQAKSELAADSVEDRLAALEKEDELDHLLA